MRIKGNKQEKRNASFYRVSIILVSGASFEGGWRAIAPQGKRKKKKEKKKKKKKKKKERKKGTINNVKLLHINCCFF